MTDDLRESRFPLDRGEAVISYPRAISTDEIDGIEIWMRLILENMKRSARNNEEAARLRSLNESLAERVADQSELLTKKAEKS